MNKVQWALYLRLFLASWRFGVVVGFSGGDDGSGRSGWGYGRRCARRDRSCLLWRRRWITTRRLRRLLVVGRLPQIWGGGALGEGHRILEWRERRLPSRHHHHRHRRRPRYSIAVTIETSLLFIFIVARYISYYYFKQINKNYLIAYFKWIRLKYLVQNSDGLLSLICLFV